MLRKAQIITFPALIALVLLLTGCPPPAEFTQWQRTSTPSWESRRPWLNVASL